MNIFAKAYCRIFQKCFFVASFALPWSQPKLLEGEGSLLKLPDLIKEKGIDSLLIVTDAGLMGLGMVNPLIDALKEKEIKVAVYDKVVPNPTVNNIEDAVAVYNENGCKAIVAFGGGSPMDCAKGVAACIARPDMPVAKMKGICKISGLVTSIVRSKGIKNRSNKVSIVRKFPLLFAIPTTAGTGSETTLAAIISNKETHEKYPIEDFMIIPPYAVLDPNLTVKLPKHVTSTTGIDALTHAVEAYIGKSNTKDTAEKARQATKLIFENLKVAYDEGTNMTARSNMQKASYLAGVSFTRAYVGYVHALAHALGGFYGTPHGLANSILLPHVLEAFGKSAYKPLAELADVVGITEKEDSREIKAKKFIQAIRDLNKYMDIPEKVLDREGNPVIKDEDIPTMVKRALKEANPLYPVPKLFGKKELTALYKKIQ